MSSGTEYVLEFVRVPPTATALYEDRSPDSRSELYSKIRCKPWFEFAGAGGHRSPSGFGQGPRGYAERLLFILPAQVLMLVFIAVFTIQAACCGDGWGL